MKLKFKLIPFMLSLLIVFGITFGICWYSYHNYRGNKHSFYEEYFHLNDYEDYESTELLENAVKFQFDEYKKASNTVALHNIDKDIAPSYSNGTIHVPGYFDIDVYITNSISEGEATYSYYFFFYNVNYQNSTYDPVDKVQVLLVNGSGAGIPEEEGEEENIYGDALLDQELEKLFDEDEDNNPKYNGLYPHSYSSDNVHYPVFDNGYKNDEDNENVTEHYVYRCAPRQNNAKEEIFNDKVPEDGTLTFAIISLNSAKNKHTELVRGTISNIDKLSEEEYEEGYAGDVYAADFSSIVGSTVAIHGAIAFGISAVIAILFYLLLMDPKEQEKKVKFTSKKQNKK